MSDTNPVSFDILLLRKPFNEFVEAMWAELVKHKDDKILLGDMNAQNVYSVAMIEIKKRLHRISIAEPEDIQRQDIHMANYLFFMWLKMKEILK